ncbi:MAG: FAD-dependent oxidoreductase [Enterococcus sp.]
MGIKQDLVPIFTKHELSFVEQSHEVEDLYSFIFQSEKKLHWQAGQHGVFTITHEKIPKPTRSFSIAAAPSEGYFQITTNITKIPSPFKQALTTLAPGEKISMRGPVGKFYLHNAQPTLLIAGGIGITPYKSIVTELSLTGESKPSHLELVYLDSKDEFLFQSLFNQLVDQQLLEVSYVKVRTEAFAKVERFIAQYGNQANYFLVGPPKMVNGFSQFLKEKQVNKKQIIKDRFFGY